MQEIFFWISFFGPPLAIALITVYVFRPSAREHYEEAKQVIFNEDENLEPARVSKPRDYDLKA